MHSIRAIQAADDPRIATIIRTVMPELGADGPGFAIHDPEVDGMTASYARARHAYFVAEVDGVVVAGGGVAPLEGGDPATCELRKMYMLREARGRGLGSELLRTCLAAARSLGFTTCYLETLVSMTDAQRLYEHHGFARLDGPRGATGHFGCDRWYAKQL